MKCRPLSGTAVIAILDSGLISIWAGMSSTGKFGHPYCACTFFARLSYSY